MTVNGVSHTMTGAANWVRYQVAVLTDRYGSNLDTNSPKYVRHAALQLAKYGV